MKYKLITIIIFGMFMISMVSAMESLGTFKQGEEIRISQVCNDATYITISSITYPNSTTSIDNFNMTYFGSGEFYYDFDSSSELGKYDVRGISDGCENTFATYFDITPLGISQTTSQGIGSFGYLILMITLMFVFGYISFKFFNTENWWIMGIFFGFMSLIFLVYNSWLGYSYHKAVTGLPTSNMPETFFYMLLILLIVGSLTCLALLFRHWRKIFKYMKKEIKRKEPNDSDFEDWDVDNWAGEDWRLRK